MTEPSTDQLTSWIELSAAAYAGNLRFIRSLVGNAVEVSPVVKANAYGHGLDVIARLANDEGAKSFCVHSLDEALRLRQLGYRQDILLLGQVHDSRLREAIEHRMTLAVFDPWTAKRLIEVAATARQAVKVHLKIETGTHRQGSCDAALREMAEALEACEWIEIEGAYTHFANIEDTTRHDYAASQRKRFADALDLLRGLGIRPRKVHTACSAAALIFAETHHDMIRLGISQYGFWPSSETQLSYQLLQSDATPSTLSPVLTWKTRLGQIKDIPADSFVGYGCTYQTTRPARLAILPIGYSDGYPRQLSNCAHVLVRGRRAPVRGRICMNLTMVDVTDIPDVEPQDEVVLLGRQGEQEITAEDLAQLAGTIHYEILTGLRPGLPRLVVL